MKNISLFNVTAIVIIIAFASSFVSAEDKVNKGIEKTQSDVAEVVEVAKQLNFPALIETLDTDKNGILSQAEVSADQNQLLQEEFTKIDVNQDKQIDEAEFNNYVAVIKDKAVKNKAVNVVKSGI